MCEKGEQSCPICTEEMDLTDKQLKPCKCGYEICVWCWHHIMNMAEKDGNEGRCPACRGPYDKARIVAMAANCRRLVAEMNSQHKKKMQKLTPKASEGRKYLSDVRVIQHNLVYIIGLPLNLADEDLLQRRDFFGRYGKVLKVSISRTATGLIQHSVNNSCCVYITYSKEVEAVRCIQSVHCFVLEGRPLRACFGTTKYCHAWLRNVPCSKRDCLYLHDYGSQEDSFTKDELVLAFARVQQVIGATNNLHRRSGNVLPPPADDPRHMSSDSKLVSRSYIEKIENQIKGSCSGSAPMNPTSFTAVTSWVMRVSGSLPPGTSSSCSGDLANRKVEASSDPQALVTGVASTERSILDTRSSRGAENSSQVHSSPVFVPSELKKDYIGGNSQTCQSNDIKEVIVEKLPGTVLSNCETSLADFVGDDKDMVAPAASTSFLELYDPHCDFSIHKAVSVDSDGDGQGFCSGLSSVSMRSCLDDPYSIPDSDRSLFTHNSINSSVGKLLQQENEYSEVHSTSPALWEDIIVDDILNLNYEQPKFCKGINGQSSALCSTCLPQNNVDQSSPLLWQQDQIRHHNHLRKPSESCNEPLETGFGGHVKSENNVISAAHRVALDMRENSIISNILSLELDALEDSLAKLLGESDEPCASCKGSTLWKVQEKNQSRFSFARQDSSMKEASDLEQTFGITGHATKGKFTSGGLMGNKDTLPGKYSHAVPSSNSALSVSKVHASSQPGFSMSSRIPPGFSCRKVERDCNSSAKHLQQQYIPPSENIGGIKAVEFNDSAILEVGKRMLAERLNNASFDMRRTLIPQFTSGEDEARLKLLMQQALPSQDLRHSCRKHIFSSK